MYDSVFGLMIGILAMMLNLVFYLTWPNVFFMVGFLVGALGTAKAAQEFYYDYFNKR